MGPVNPQPTRGTQEPAIPTSTPVASDPLLSQGPQLLSDDSSPLLTRLSGTGKCRKILWLHVCSYRWRHSVDSSADPWIAPTSEQAF
jgi:hypothetical protein